jgi:nitroreductase
MNALEALHSRGSLGKLSEPAPRGEALDNMLKAALRASDHQRLRPWRFLLIEGEAREKLGQIFAEAALATDPGLSSEKQTEIAAKALRAPLIVVVVARVREHPKVPDIEQLLSAGAAAQLMLVAAHAQGFAGIWRTGGVAYDPRVALRLGLESGDRIVGFLYLGTASAQKKIVETDPAEFTVHWRG